MTQEEMEVAQDKYEVELLMQRLRSALPRWSPWQQAQFLKEFVKRLEGRE